MRIIPSSYTQGGIYPPLYTSLIPTGRHIPTVVHLPYTPREAVYPPLYTRYTLLGRQHTHRCAHLTHREAGEAPESLSLLVFSVRKAPESLVLLLFPVMEGSREPLFPLFPVMEGFREPL